MSGCAGDAERTTSVMFPPCGIFITLLCVLELPTQLLREIREEGAQSGRAVNSVEKEPVLSEQECSCFQLDGGPGLALDVAWFPDS